MDDDFFQAGMRHYRNREYFDAQLAWEESWRSAAGGRKSALEVLMFAAAGLHASAEGDGASGRRYLGAARAALAKLDDPAAAGVDLGGLLADAEAALPPAAPAGPAVDPLRGAQP